MKFLDSPLLAAILGGNGKEVKAQEETARAERATLRLQEAIRQTGPILYEAAKEAMCVLSDDRADFDVEKKLKALDIEASSIRGLITNKDTGK